MLASAHLPATVALMHRRDEVKFLHRPRNVARDPAPAYALAAVPQRPALSG